MSDAAPVRWSPASLLLASWLVGCALLWTAVGWKYWRLTRAVQRMRPIDEGPARVELERLAQRLGVRSVPELYATDRATSPMLLGVVRPKIVLPEGVLARLDPEEVRLVLAHELVHWRRRDTWIGWLQVLVQGVFWFHPLVWWANSRLRHERECACDETVLRDVASDRDGYGETIVRVVTAARGRSLAMANMVGVFERGSQLQMRLEEIMSFDPKKRRFGWMSKASSTPTTCGQSSGTASVSITNAGSSGGAAATYVWSNGGNTSTITNLSVAIFAVGAAPPFATFTEAVLIQPEAFVTVT
jgi:beta-lactamase regulating signal transducer with metallopeptidase domain